MNAPSTTDGAEVLTMLETCGIPIETLDTCATLVYEWTCSDEPDARVLVVKIAEVLRDVS